MQTIISRKDKNMYSASHFRARARQTLGGNIFSHQWIYAMLVSVIASAVLSLIGPVGIVLSGVIYYGTGRYYLERARGNVRHDALGVCLEGFIVDMPGNLVLGLLTTLYTFLWTLLFIIPGIVKSYAYSMAYYIKADNPAYTATEAIEVSQRMMRGHKFELFILDLSFIGWYIVGILCLGVGTFWVSAYHESARAEFYQTLAYETPMIV